MATDNFGNQIPANPMTPEIYQASLPDIVRTTMQPLAGTPDAWPAAIKLSLQGYVIDKAIQVYGWNPVLVMSMRIALGLKFVQSIAAEPLPGKIKVSLDAADYPAVDIPPAPPNVTDMVGTIVVNNQIVPNLLWTMDNVSYFAPGPGCYGPHGVKVQTGQQFVQDGVTYTALVKVGPLGLPQVFMTTTAAA